MLIRGFLIKKLIIFVNILFFIITFFLYSDFDILSENPDDILKILLWDAPGTLVPYATTGVKDNIVFRIIFEPLATYDKTQNLIPVLAENIPSVKNGQLNSDLTSVTWKLKENLKWSDGHSLTASDILFTLNYILNPEHNLIQVFDYKIIKEIKVTDKHTITLYFNFPNHIWDNILVGPLGIVIPEHIYSKYKHTTDPQEIKKHVPVGSGPYMLSSPGIIDFNNSNKTKSFSYKNKIELSLNPYYNNKNINIFKKVIIIGGSTPVETARLAVEFGKIDYAWNIWLEPDKLKKLKKKGSGKIISTYQTTSVEQLEFNFTDPDKETADGERSSIKFPHPILTNIIIRQALAHAVNRKAIAELYGDSAIISDKVIYHIAPYSAANEYYKYDLTRAGKLLDTAGWTNRDENGIRYKNNLKFSLVFHTYKSHIAQKIQRIIQNDYKKIGVEIKIMVSDASVYYGSDYNNPGHNIRFLSDMQLSSWTLWDPDPQSMLGYWTTSEMPQMQNNWQGANFRRWSNPVYDNIFSTLTEEIDAKQRLLLQNKLNNMLTREVVSIPLVNLGRISGISSTLGGFDPNPWEMPVWNISQWYRIK